uniref:Uncharacterized protein n=1 Tax=Ciona intestinalis TaxID=7719 RepID=H2XNG0_CIOIN
TPNKTKCVNFCFFFNIFFSRKTSVLKYAAVNAFTLLTLRHNLTLLRQQFHQSQVVMRPAPLLYTLVSPDRQLYEQTLRFRPLPAYFPEVTVCVFSASHCMLSYLVIAS